MQTYIKIGLFFYRMKTCKLAGKEFGELPKSGQMDNVKESGKYRAKLAKPIAIRYMLPIA